MRSSPSAGAPACGKPYQFWTCHCRLAGPLGLNGLMPTAIGRTADSPAPLACDHGAAGAMPPCGLGAEGQERAPMNSVPNGFFGSQQRIRFCLVIGSFRTIPKRVLEAVLVPLFPPVPMYGRRAHYKVATLIDAAGVPRRAHA